MNISQLLAFMYTKKKPTQTTKNKAGKEKDAQKKPAFLILTIAYMYVSLENLLKCWEDLQFCFLEKYQKLEEIQKQPPFHKILRS